MLLACLAIALGVLLLEAAWLGWRGRLRPVAAELAAGAALLGAFGSHLLGAPWPVPAAALAVGGLAHALAMRRALARPRAAAEPARELRGGRAGTGPQAPAPSNRAARAAARAPGGGRSGAPAAAGRRARARRRKASDRAGSVRRGGQPGVPTT
ncbi:hypothetical protein [Piscinibacter sakaiensis]|uniref:Uncharacterized protein n=1 Tax=Piscinibacter sakaiensis TaxID=1547922 RepID=A0A0K8NVH9_PISS1|nr:hypothetical protein [Piscinibacter sakaiensis]GAP34397.1 hypothetical protein ISF6_4572 [Piscinibacter sakaiensis]